MIYKIVWSEERTVFFLAGLARDFYDGCPEGKKLRKNTVFVLCGRSSGTGRVYNMNRITLSYRRVSGGPHQDMEAQDRILDEYIAAKGIADVRNIWDEVSGRKKKRPRFEEVCSLVRQGVVKAIIVQKYDRIGRNARENLQLAELCKARNTDIISVQDGLTLLGQDGAFMFGLLSLLAEREWERISKSTKAGMDVAKAAGKCIGGSKGGHSDRIMSKIPALKQLLAAGMKRYAAALALDIEYKTVCLLVKEGLDECKGRTAALAAVPFERRGKRYQEGVLNARAMMEQ